jgi:hypothetical protein
MAMPVPEPLLLKLLFEVSRERPGGVLEVTRRPSESNCAGEDGIRELDLRRRVRDLMRTLLAFNKASAASGSCHTVKRNGEIEDSRGRTVFWRELRSAST